MSPLRPKNVKGLGVAQVDWTSRNGELGVCKSNHQLIISVDGISPNQYRLTINSHRESMPFDDERLLGRYDPGSGDGGVGFNGLRGLNVADVGLSDIGGGGEEEEDITLKIDDDDRDRDIYGRGGGLAGS